MSLIGGDARPPMMAVPPLMVDGVVAAHHKQVNAVGQPGDRRDVGDNIPAMILPTTPAMTIPPLVIDGMIAAYHKQVNMVGCPGDR